MASKSQGKRSRVSEASAATYSAAKDVWTYVESSALAAAIIEGDETCLRILAKPQGLMMSSLTVAETLRAIVRARVAGRISQENADVAAQDVTDLQARVTTISMADAVLKRVGKPFPNEPIRVLDAIHVATIEWLALGPHVLKVLTRDARVRSNVLTMGYQVL